MTNSQKQALLCYAGLLLPEEIEEGTRLHWEAFVYSISEG